MRTELGINSLLMMYVGNLESYQGIDLLLESFALVCNKTERLDLVVIGGDAVDIQKYQRRVRSLNIDRKVHFLGPKPVESLAEYLSQADILVSPRIKGINTPLKIFSYLHSGKALLATNLPTHTQVLDNQAAMLAAPSPEEFSKAMLRLTEDENLRAQLGISGRRLIDERFSYAVFHQTANSLFDWLKTEVGQEPLATVK
jgi:glycosyltransferase involved in cell wall biosynthesis